MSSDRPVAGAFEALSLGDPSPEPSKALQPYQYLPLESPSHIRLLSFSFKPRSSKPIDQIPESLEDVDIDVIHVDLQREPQYRAFSYVWGKTTSPAEIRVNGDKKIIVSASLVEILNSIVRLQENSKLQALPLWIDQLCINQHNLEERGQQVSMMGTIYMSADHVLAWLGEPNEELTRSFMHLIRTYRAKSSEGLTWDLCRSVMKEQIELQFDPQNPSEKAKRFLAVQEVLNRPWFQRAWVFQEAVLSKEVKMVIGRYLFYFPELYRLVTHILGIQYAINGFRNSIGKTTTGYEPMQSIRDLRQQWIRKEEPKPFLRFVCRAGGYWRATEKRDMVYAFLGLLNKPGLFIPLGYTIQPNYSAPLRDVYISLTRTVIEGSRNLDLLANVVGDEPYLEPMDMRIQEHIPSWVPDWGISTPTVIAFHNSDDNSFNACKGYPYVPIPSPPEVLLVRGKIVSIVETWINHPFEKHYFMNPDRGWLAVDFHYEKMISAVAPGTKHSITREKVLKALLADGALVWPFRTVTPENPSNLSDERVKELLHAYDMWPRIVANDTTLSGFQKVKEDLKEVQQRSMILQRKRLAGCSGDGGTLGLVPRICMQKDDHCEIAILHGSKVPVVIEEVEEGTDRWKVIGQCYLEGAMYGELVDWGEEEGDLFTIV